MATHGVVYDLSEEVTAEELEECVIGEFQRSQRAYQKGFVRLQPYNQVMPRVYAKYERTIKEFECRESDVWIASFPKSGTKLYTYLLLYSTVYTTTNIGCALYCDLISHRDNLDRRDGMVHPEQSGL